MRRKEAGELWLSQLPATEYRFVAAYARPIVWGQVLGTIAGSLEATQGSSRTTSKRAGEAHRPKENKAGSTPPIRQAMYGSLHGKEGVNGSSPLEGSAKAPHVGAFVFRATCSSSIVRWVWSRLWSFRV